MQTPTKHKGAQAELSVCAWLLSQGYEVFRNVSQHGAVDLVAIESNTGEIILIEVRTIFYTHADGQPYINRRMREFPLPIKIISFHPWTLKCEWVEELSQAV